ncbi:hypothetical protein AVEN_8705-1 [Araneus ventricosus]|uniref:Uncharacterized protein n=1 Tax=Araneus ventricosus TaxID=182803 RepID=A0A4Y2GDD6_ARAVE|nr:hypothetical protein AVEN_8705-1 [Araneus ventricosus]
MIWREPSNHSDDCYFCSLNVHGLNAKNRKGILYPNIPSAMRPVPGIHIPKPTEKLKDTSSDSEEEDDGSDDDFNAAESNDPQLFPQSELNDLVRDLGLSKNSAELLDVDLVYCSNIPGLMAQFQIEYDAQEFRLFVDSCKRSFKAVLLHNVNKYTSKSVGHSVHYKECYENLAIILNKLKYKDHMWTICGDLKVIANLLGLQGGNTKYPCFLCEWDSRERSQHWIKREWPVGEKLEIGSKYVIEEALVDRETILLPPLHIKLGLRKQFVKALNKEGRCFKHFIHAFPGLSATKVKECVFVGPDIRIFM